MIDINKLVRDNVRSLVPYSCARDEFSGKEGIFMDANENPFGDLNRYPDPYHKKLKASVSKLKGIPVDNIFLGNGSDEVIDLCLRIFCNPGIDKALTFSPSYGMYEVSAAVNDVGIIKVPLNKSFQINLKKVKAVMKDDKLKVIFICSPNNPTANCMNPRDVEFIIRNFKGIILIDEAYIDFSGMPSFSNIIEQYSNLIVMQTFSKSLGLAAVRVGMAFSNPEIIHYFYKMKQPYNISTINQKTALKRLAAINSYREQVKIILVERKRLSENLKKLSIIETVFPSDSNFLLVKVRDADLIYNTLINNKIIIRNRSKIIKNCLRITVGTRTENNKLIRELKRISI